MTVQAVPRFSTSLALALLVTGGLLLLMQALIATGQAPFVDAPRIRLPPLIPFIEETPVTTRERVEPPPPPVQPPVVPRIGTETTMGVQVVVTPPTGPATDDELAFADAADGAPVALVKVAATYPPRAIGRGLEGYVIVEYTVTELGTVADVRVVESTEVAFEASAVAAAERFRYKPRIVAGQAVATPGVLNKFTFALEN